jgi:hypothetical protein
MFIDCSYWDIAEVSLADIGARSGVSIYEYNAGRHPRLLLVKLNLLPWTLVVQVAPCDSALCNIFSNYEIMKAVGNWGSTAMQLEKNYKLFVKELGDSGFEKETLPVHIFGNIAGLGAYLGKASLRFGSKGWLSNGMCCSGVVIPNEWLQVLVDFYIEQVRIFPTRSFIKLTGPYYKESSDYDDLPVSFRLARWAMSLSDAKSLERGINIYSWDDFKSLDEFNAANQSWLDSALDVASHDQLCDLPMPHDDLIRHTPRIRNQYSRLLPWLKLERKVEFDLYLRRAQLAAAMECPHHYWGIDEAYANLKDDETDQVREICAHLKSYLDAMQNKFSFFLKEGITFPNID